MHEQMYRPLVSPPGHPEPPAKPRVQVRRPLAPTPPAQGVIVLDRKSAGDCCTSCVRGECCSGKSSEPGAGEPLPEEPRARLERATGTDLSAVRIHRNAESARSAEAHGADAYTIGQHIHFGAGKYDPASESGQRLLAHEVAHTVQQRGAVQSPMAALEVSEPGDPHEVEAEQFSDSVALGQLGKITSARVGRISRACSNASMKGSGSTPTNVCTIQDRSFVHGSRLKFCQDSTELLPGQEALLDRLVTQSQTASALEIHGNASVEGPSGDYNRNLACHRAATIASILSVRGVKPSATLFAHDPTNVYGGPVENRNVVVVIRSGGKEPQKEEPSCKLYAEFTKTPPNLRQLATLQGNRLATWFGISGHIEAEPGGGAAPGQDCTCAYVEYRQYVKGKFTRDGKSTQPPICDTEWKQDEFHEDCRPEPGGKQLIYGHRNNPGKNSHYRDDNGSINEASGCFYDGSDTPGIFGNSGEVVGMDLTFRGKMIDTRNNAELFVREWVVFGVARIP